MGEGSVRGMAAEVEPEVMVGEAKVAGGEEEVYSGATVVLSEGGTELNEEEEVAQPMGNREDKGAEEKLNEEEEVIQSVENRELEIEQAVGTRGQEIEPVVEPRETEIEQDVGHREGVILIDDEEVVEQPTEVVSQRTGQLKEVLATSGWMAVRNTCSDDEEDEEGSTLLRRPRSIRRQQPRRGDRRRCQMGRKRMRKRLRKRD